MNMMMKTMTTKKLKVGMRQQKKNLAFHQMDVTNLKLTQTQLQSVKKTWILQTTGTYYLLANDLTFIYIFINYNSQRFPITVNMDMKDYKKIQEITYKKKVVLLNVTKIK